MTSHSKRITEILFHLKAQTVGKTRVLVNEALQLLEGEFIVCNCCNISKHNEEFYDLEGGKFGKHPKCKECMKQANNNNYHLKKDEREKSKKTSRGSKGKATKARGQQNKDA